MTTTKSSAHMINPSSINLLSLPWLPLDEKSAFPQKPAIYFAIDSYGIVQYIGRSFNPKYRWASHHKYKDLCVIGKIKVAYLFIDTPELLPEVESALISWFDPPLNVVGKSRHNLEKKAFRSTKRLICNLKKIVDIKNTVSEGEKITQSAIAKDTGIAVTTVHRLYNNNFNRVDTNTVEVLCEYLGCEVGDLFVLKKIKE